LETDSARRAGAVGSSGKSGWQSDPHSRRRASGLLRVSSRFSCGPAGRRKRKHRITPTGGRGASCSALLFGCPLPLSSCVTRCWPSSAGPAQPTARTRSAAALWAGTAAAPSGDASPALGLRRLQLGSAFEPDKTASVRTDQRETTVMDELRCYDKGRLVSSD